MVSRSADLVLEGAEVVANLEEALEVATNTGTDEIMITGGGQIYALMMDRADKLYITEVDAEPEGDTVFPEIDPTHWEKTHEEDVPRGEKDSAQTIYRIYERK